MISFPERARRPTLISSIYQAWCASYCRPCMMKGLEIIDSVGGRRVTSWCVFGLGITLEIQVSKLSPWNSCVYKSHSYLFYPIFESTFNTSDLSYGRRDLSWVFLPIVNRRIRLFASLTVGGSELRPLTVATSKILLPSNYNHNSIYIITNGRKSISLIKWS